METYQCVFNQSLNGCKLMEGGRCMKRCSFYLTKEQRMISIAIAFDRLRHHSRREQKAIADKYYNGKMPWQKRGAF